MEDPKPVRVFISYAHQDKTACQPLFDEVDRLKSLGLIATWSDKALTPGCEWPQTIRSELDKASIILLLISQAFLESDYISSVEAVRAIQRHNELTAVVIPVLISEAKDWRNQRIAGTRLGDLQALPSGNVPVSQWDPPGRAYDSITEGIRQAALRIAPRIVVAVHVRPGTPNARPQHLIDALVRADEVTIFGLTHENLAAHLQQALTERKRSGRGFWRDLSIVFASEEFLRLLPEERRRSGMRSPEARVNAWMAAKRQIFHFLLSEGRTQRDNWSCHEYPHSLPFVGTLVRGGGVEGSPAIRIAHILPGVDLNETLYLELTPGNPVFEQIANVFHQVCSNSRLIVEWNPIGTIDEEVLLIEGLVNRRAHEQCPDDRTLWFLPVVLIILHRNRGLLLQKRTSFNASSGLGKYSNISGVVTDLDLISALEKEPRHEYFERNYCQRDRTGAEVWADFRLESELPTVTLPLNDKDSRSECTRTGRMWRRAAIRELQEELGLAIAASRLLFHRYLKLPPTSPEKITLYFAIHSLELGNGEWEQIRKRRPHAELELFGRRELRLKHKDNQLNTLLQNNFEEVFEGILDGLGID